MVKLETKTGSINAETRFIRANSELNLSSEVGSIRLKLPDNCVPNLSLNSSVGHIRNDFKGLPATTDGPRVFVKTNVGSIRINKQKARQSKKPLTVLPAEAMESN